MFGIGANQWSLFSFRVYRTLIWAEDLCLELCNSCSGKKRVENVAWIVNYFDSSAVMGETWRFLDYLNWTSRFGRGLGFVGLQGMGICVLFLDYL